MGKNIRVSLDCIRYLGSNPTFIKSEKLRDRRVTVNYKWKLRNERVYVLPSVVKSIGPIDLVSMRKQDHLK